MLQQTRVAAVLEHYRKFLKRFPTIRDLAAASEADVLAAWSGLGYYRRARMLHKAARQLVTEHDGQLPTSTKKLQQLPGIGRYTGNAISSIAFGEAVAVVDGNVKRVLSRVSRHESSGKDLWITAQRLLDPANAGDFNQAMMELGATICTPVAPLCNQCPIGRHCASENLPPRKTSVRENRLRRTASVVLRRRRNAILLQQRPARESLMPGMWELPQLTGASVKRALLRVRHSITQTDWTVEVYDVGEPARMRKLQWVQVSQLGALPLTGLTRKILRKLKLLA